MSKGSSFTLRDVEENTDSLNSGPSPHTFPYPSITFVAAMNEFLLILHTFLILSVFFLVMLVPFASTCLISDFTLENEVLMAVHSAWQTLCPNQSTCRSLQHWRKQTHLTFVVSFSLLPADYPWNNRGHYSSHKVLEEEQPALPLSHSSGPIYLSVGDWDWIFFFPGGSPLHLLLPVPKAAVRDMHTVPLVDLALLCTEWLSSYLLRNTFSLFD